MFLVTAIPALQLAITSLLHLDTAGVLARELRRGATTQGHPCRVATGTPGGETDFFEDLSNLLINFVSEVPLMGPKRQRLRGRSDIAKDLFRGGIVTYLPDLRLQVIRND